MNHTSTIIQRDPSERGSAILMVLGVLSLLLILALIFAMTSRNAQTVADAGADQTQARLLADGAATTITTNLFLLQNKGNLLGSAALDGALPPDAADLDQSASTLGTASKPKDYLYHAPGSNPNFLGMQPYIGTPNANISGACLYGEFSEDGNDTNSFALMNGSDKPVQPVFYSHSNDTYDEPASEGANSLYEIVASTKLGQLYHDAGTVGTTGTNQFEGLLKDTLTHQLQFIPEQDADGHIVSRQGYLAFSDGGKFDLNQLVIPGMASDANAPYAPIVENGKLAESAGTGTDFYGGYEDYPSGQTSSVGYSVYPIAGFKYHWSTDNAVMEFYDHGKVVEEETVQYGIHPQELRTRWGAIGGGTAKNIYLDDALKRGDSAVAPRWFTYDQLIAGPSTLTTQAQKDDYRDYLKRDIFVLSLASGTADRELRFNGQYGNMDDLLGDLDADGNLYLDDSDNYQAKANIAFPWGLYEKSGSAECTEYGSNIEKNAWDAIGDKAKGASDKADLESMSKHFFKKHLGLKEKDLFKADDGTDLTTQVFANMVDFCDSDNAVTFAFDTSDMTNKMRSTSTSFNERPGTTGTSMLSEPTYCGNERVPVVVGANVAFNGIGGNVKIQSVESFNYGGTSGYEMRVPAATIQVTPTVTVSIQNFLNEKLVNLYNQKYRVVVQGKITPFFLAKQAYFMRIRIGGAETWIRRYRPAVFLNGNNTAIYPNNALLSSWDSSANMHNDDNSYGLVYGSTYYTNLVNSIQGVVGTDFTMDVVSSPSSGNCNELQNQVYTFTDTAHPINVDIKTMTCGNKNYVSGSSDNYYCTGIGLAVRIEKVIVMAYDSAGEPTDIVYTEAPNGTDGNPGEWRLASTHSTTGAFDAEVNYNELATSGQKCPVDGILLAGDPRLNHNSSEWQWMQSADFTALGGDTSGLFQNNNLASLQNQSFSGRVFTAMNNPSITGGSNTKLFNDSSDSRDWEPEFDNLALTGGKLNKTLSTYFIPNYPFTSLWQLGAIHRGERGRTLNLKRFGLDITSTSSEITNKYEDGDAWLLDYLNLSELDIAHGVRGKFNPNCFNPGSYRFLFANIPANEDAEDTVIYANAFLDPTTSETKHNTYFRDYIDENATGTLLDMEDKVFSFRNGDVTNQSWSPVQAFFNFVDIDGGSTGTRQCNDRQAESLIGCTAGLLSTRYETFTVIAAGQSTRFIMADGNLPGSGTDEATFDDDRRAFLKQIANPQMLSDGNWYSILSTQVRLVTLVRDCWFGKITVVKSQTL